MKKVIGYFKIIAICLMGILMLAGCQKNSTSTTWKYNTPEKVDDVTITKSVYEEDSLTIYYKGKISKDITECYCYDKNGNRLDGQWNMSIRNSKIVIQGEGAKNISGVALEDKGYNESYRLRFLNSDQCVMLHGEFALDLGMKYSGDQERYKTEEEKEREQARKEAEIAAMEEVYSLIEGNWYNDKDENLFINVVKEDNGYCYVEFSDENFYPSLSLYGAEIVETDGVIYIYCKQNGWELPGGLYIIYDPVNNCILDDLNNNYYYREEDLDNNGRIKTSKKSEGIKRISNVSKLCRNSSYEFCK